MARAARKKSSSGVYHAMVRGVNRQLIFEDASDYAKFLEVLAACKELGGFALHAYCLMSNHVHLLLQPSDTEPLETVFRRIGGRYVMWFNRKYGRTGHLFQDRFASEPIEDDAQLVSCARYIMQNPVAAGMVETPFEYPYSSARDYLDSADGAGLADTAMVSAVIGDNIEGFLLAPNTAEHLELGERAGLTDRELREVMGLVSGCANSSEFQELDRGARDAAIAEMRRSGGSIRQVSRVTGVGTGIVRRCRP